MSKNPKALDLLDKLILKLEKNIQISGEKVIKPKV